MHAHKLAAVAARAARHGAQSRRMKSNKAGVKPIVSAPSPSPTPLKATPAPPAAPPAAGKAAVPSTPPAPPAKPGASTTQPVVGAGGRADSSKASGGGGSGLGTVLLLGVGAGSAAYFFRRDLGIEKQLTPLEEKVQSLLSLATAAPAPAPAPAAGTEKAQDDKPQEDPAAKRKQEQAAAHAKAQAAKLAQEGNHVKGALLMAGAVQHEEARKATEQASKAAEAAAKAKEAPAPAPAPTPSPAPAAAAAQDDGEGDSASSAQEGDGEDSAAAAPAPAPEAAPAKLKSLEDIVESAKSRAKEFNAEMSSSALASKWLSAALKDDLNTSIAMEVEGMDEAALRSRVLNLSAQLLQRNKVEAARILEFMSEYNAHWQGRFEEFSAAQTSAFQADVQAAKQAFQQQVAEENSRILQAEAARLEADIRMQVTTQLSQAVQKEAAARAAAAAARVEALDELRAKVEGVSTVVGTRQEYETTARRVHSITLSALALSAALDKGAPLTDEVAAMRVAVAEEPGVAAALDAIPPHVFGRRGAPTRFALDNKFKAALAEARVAALTPAAGGVLSRWIGRATAALLLSPVPTPATPAADVLAAGKDAASAPRGGVAAVSSTVQGAIESVASTSTGQAVGAHVASARQSALSAVSSTAQSVRSGVSEAVAGALPEGFVSEAGEFLSRARQALPPPGESTATSLALLQQAEEAWAAGDLHRTVALVEQLRGLPAAEMKGWLAAATTRAIVEQAVAVSHAYASSVAGSLY